MFSEVWHRRIFLFGLISLSSGLLFGSVLTSVPQIILITNWLLELNFSKKIKSLFTMKLFWALCSLFFLHIIVLLRYCIIFFVNITCIYLSMYLRIHLSIHIIIFSFAQL